jgi:hypothetical protein
MAQEGIDCYLIYRVKGTNEGLGKAYKCKVVSSCFKDDSFSRLCLQDSCFGHRDHYLVKGLCKLADILAFTIIIMY